MACPCFRTNSAATMRSASLKGAPCGLARAEIRGPFLCVVPARHHPTLVRGQAEWPPIGSERRRTRRLPFPGRARAGPRAAVRLAQPGRHRSLHRRPSVPRSPGGPRSTPPTLITSCRSPAGPRAAVRFVFRPDTAIGHRRIASLSFLAPACTSKDPTFAKNSSPGLYCVLPNTP